MHGSLQPWLFLVERKASWKGSWQPGAGSLLRPRAHLHCHPRRSTGKTFLDLQFSATGVFLQIAIGKTAQLGLVKSQGGRDGVSALAL